MLIDWFTVGAQAVNFLILVWLLKRFLYEPVLAAIDAREKKIAAELAELPPHGGAGGDRARGPSTTQRRVRPRARGVAAQSRGRGRRERQRLRRVGSAGIPDCCAPN